MVHDSPRIAELRRRLQADPASTAFAQLAEEYRRAESYTEAAETCRSGLQRHPTYASARVTLGCALLGLTDLEGAQREFELVLRSAPENLSALRGAAEAHRRRGQLADALTFLRRALTLSPKDAELQVTITRIEGELCDGGGMAPSSSAPGNPLHEFVSPVPNRPHELGVRPIPPAGEPPARALMDFEREPLAPGPPASAEHQDDIAGTFDEDLRIDGDWRASDSTGDHASPDDARLGTAAITLDDRLVDDLERWLDVIDRRRREARESDP